MATQSAVKKGLEPVEDDDASVAEPLHVLRVGGREFACRDKLPVATLLRYADNDMLSLHHLLVKLVNPDEIEEMWDAFEEADLDQEELAEVVKEVVEGYTERPTEGPSRSSGGSRNTRRK